MRNTINKLNHNELTNLLSDLVNKELIDCSMPPPILADHYIDLVNKEHFDQSIKNAVESFFGSVAKDYPEIDTGDMSPEELERFENQAKEIILTWLRNNQNTK